MKYSHWRIQGSAKDVPDPISFFDLETTNLFALNVHLATIVNLVNDVLLKYLPISFLFLFFALFGNFLG